MGQDKTEVADATAGQRAANAVICTENRSYQCTCPDTQIVLKQCKKNCMERHLQWFRSSVLPELFN